MRYLYHMYIGRSSLDCMIAFWRAVSVNWETPIKLNIGTAHTQAGITAVHLLHVKQAELFAAKCTGICHSAAPFPLLSKTAYFSPFMTSVMPVARPAMACSSEGMMILVA